MVTGEVVAGGPKAPKDAVKKRPAFCIMRNKQIAGSPQKDGTGISFIYESDGRLNDAARLIGGITDENIISMLNKVDTIKKLVHSIGVTVEADGNDHIGFFFQMYGHTNPYVSGTTISMDIPCDGMEHVLVLDDYEWSEDDNIPGQIRFLFAHGGDLGVATVRFYLNDGFEAPAEEDDCPVDFASESYTKMIEKSLVNMGNNVRIKRAIDKARRGEDVTLAFIGGSITQGAGAIPINTECYSYKIFKGFCDYLNKSVDENIHYIKAGVGGTPSELGMLRYDRDVLDNGKVSPDIVLVEFAVNDEGDETQGESYDSLVRKIYNGKGNPAVILLFSVFSNDYNLEERLKPVGFAYNLPMVSTKQSVVEQFYLKSSEGRVVSKAQYFYDCYHPTNTGHTIMADGVLSLIKKMDKAAVDKEETDITKIVPPKGGEFENIIVLDRIQNTVDAVIDCGDFTDTDTELQAVERNLDLVATPQFPNNWMYRGSKGGKNGVSFKLDVKCTALLIIYKDSADIKDGKVSVYADGEKKLTIDPHIIGWIHCNPFIVIRGAKDEVHHIEVVPEDPSKDFTILGFGICK